MNEANVQRTCKDFVPLVTFCVTTFVLLLVDVVNSPIITFLATNLKTIISFRMRSQKDLK